MHATDFQKGKPELLPLIHRKKGKDSAHAGAAGAADDDDEKALTTTASKRAGPAVGSSKDLAAADNEEPTASTSALTIDLHTLLREVAAIRESQTSIAADLKSLASSNQQLWAEAISSRERHQKHQDTINKIVRFLGSVFGGKVLSPNPADPSNPAGKHSAQQNNSSHSPRATSSTSDPFFTANAAPQRPPQRTQRLLLTDTPASDYPVASGSSNTYINTAGSSTGHLNRKQPNIEIEVPMDELDDLPLISSSTSDLDFLHQANGHLAYPPHYIDNSSTDDHSDNRFSAVPSADSPDMPRISTFEDGSAASTPSANPSSTIISSSSNPNAALSNSSIANQQQQLSQVARDQSTINAQMDNLQAALDRLVANLPPSAADHSAQPPAPSSSSTAAWLMPDAPNQQQQQSIDDFDLDSFLQQFGTGDSSSSLPDYLQTGTSSSAAAFPSFASPTSATNDSLAADYSYWQNQLDGFNGDAAGDRIQPASTGPSTPVLGPVDEVAAASAKISGKRKAGADGDFVGSGPAKKQKS